MARLTTIVATVRAGGVSQTRIEAEIRATLTRLGVELEIPCGWAPDPDVIAECTETKVAVIDINGQESRRRWTSAD